MADIDFRPLTRDDFPLLCGWLAKPHIQRWWADDASPEGVAADYGASVAGQEPCEVFIARHGGLPLGLAQRLRLADYPQYVRELQALLPIPPHACSIDYFIGDLANTSRGLGTAMLRAFTQMLWRDDPKADTIIVPVHAQNTGSWRALEKIGYVRAASGLLEPDNPADTRDHYIYRLARPAGRLTRPACD